jgi:hypothetical protein
MILGGGQATCEAEMGNFLRSSDGVRNGLRSVRRSARPPRRFKPLPVSSPTLLVKSGEMTDFAPGESLEELHLDLMGTLKNAAIPRQRSSNVDSSGSERANPAGSAAKMDYD